MALGGCASQNLLPQSDALHLKDYSHFTIRAMFWLAGVSEQFPTHRGISTYRLVYEVTAPDGRKIEASGLVAIPRGDEPIKGIVSWQHGTASLSSAAPSNLDQFNGLLPAAVFAGHGYILLAPDYIGYGVSAAEPHSYYHKASMAASVVEFLNAAKAALAENGYDWSDNLYLTGFSQGGHASLAALEVMGVPVTGVAPVAGAVDLATTGIQSAFRGESKFSSLYVAWIAETYHRDYGLDLRTVLKPDWIPVVTSIFDGNTDGDTIVETLPANPREMITEEVLVAVETGNGHPFLDLLKQNEIGSLATKTPICAYYGSADVDVTPDQGEHLIERIPNAGVVILDGDDHEASILSAVPALRTWFDTGAAATCTMP